MTEFMKPALTPEAWQAFTKPTVFGGVGMDALHRIAARIFFGALLPPEPR